MFATTRSEAADLSIDQVVEQNVNLIKLERYLAAVYGVRQLSCRAAHSGGYWGRKEKWMKERTRILRQLIGGTLLAVVNGALVGLRLCGDVVSSRWEELVR